jgi:hypothetical protein
MSRPTGYPHTDPTADAAALLRRIGFATLMMLVPIMALLARRAVVVLVPIGVLLLVIAAVLDRQHASFWPRIRLFLMSRTSLAAWVVLGWCALSLLWTPFLAEASERLLNVAATLTLAFLGYLALPERMRVANLYLIVIGVTMAGLSAIVAVLTSASLARISDESGQNLMRGLIILSIFAWPAAAWLRSRDRGLEAVCVVAIVAFAALFAPRSLSVIAFTMGGVVFIGISLTRPKNMMMTVSILAGSVAGCVLLAPLLPLIALPVAKALLGVTDPIVLSISVWKQIVIDEPVRLITGHGFETALRGRFVGLLPANAPHSLLFEIWYELGLVGAVAGAGALYCGMMALARLHIHLVPGAMATFITAFAQACFGMSIAQMWWMTSLATVVLIFVALERGQFRTTRPKAVLSTAS